MNLIQEKANSKTLPLYYKKLKKDFTKVFNKNTGDKEYEFESITKTALFFNCNAKAISKICDKKENTYKGYIFIKEKNYNPLLEYKKISKAKEAYYEPKGRFQGYPVQTYNLQSKEIIKTYNNRKELAKEFNTSTGYIAKVISGEKKSFRGMGIRKG